MRLRGFAAIIAFCVTSVAQADDLVTSMATIGDARSWATVSILLALVLTVTFTTLIGVRRSQRMTDEKMVEIVAADSPFRREVVSRDQAHALLESLPARTLVLHRGEIDYDGMWPP